MAVLFRNHEFTVENRMLTGWRVTCHYLRQTYRPSWAVSERMGLTWPLIRRHAHASPKDRDRAEAMLMQAFALAVTDAGTRAEQDFLAGTPATLAAQIMTAAEAHRN